MEKSVTIKVIQALSATLLLIAIAVTVKTCKREDSDPLQDRLEEINDSLMQEVMENSIKIDSLYLKIDSLDLLSDTIINKQSVVNEYYNQEVTISLVLMLVVLTASSQKSLKFRTPSSKQDSFPVLSTYQTSLINLNFNSMMYWYDAATRMERLYLLQREKLDYYYKITGVQATSIQDLQMVYENKVAIEKKIKDEAADEVNKLKKQVKGLKIKNTILTIGVGGLALTTAYFAIF